MSRRNTSQHAAGGMVTLPRYAMVLEDEMERKVDDGLFFQALSQLDARDPHILSEFMDSYRDVRIKVRELWLIFCLKQNILNSI